MTKDSVTVNNRPILYIALATFLAVMISAISIVTSTVFALTLIFVVLIIALVLLFSFISLKKTKLFIVFLISMLVFTAVSCNFIYNYSNYSRGDMSGVSDFKGSVISIGEIYTDKDGNKLRKINVEGTTHKGEVRASLYIDSDLISYVGSEIEFSGNFYKSSIIYDGNFSVYALSDKVFYSVSEIEMLKINTTSIVGTFNKLKFNIYNGFRATMPRNYAICYAMVVGDDSYVYSGLTDSFRNMGIAHVFAVSGLHIGFVYLLLSYIFKVLKVKKLLQLLIAFIVLLVYVAFCGFSPSCIRAFVIIFTASLSSVLREKRDRLTALSLAFTITLLINPFDLFTAGFQLSFIVYFSLVFLTKPIYKFLSKFSFDKVAKYLAPYLSAYLASLPLSIDLFGYSSVFSMLFNMLFVPVLGFVYILVFLLAIAILIMPYYGIFAFLPKVLLNFVINFINLIDTNLFLIQNFMFGFSKYPYYLLGVVNANLINLSKKSKIIINLTLFIVFILSITCINLLL